MTAPNRPPNGSRHRPLNRLAVAGLLGSTAAAGLLFAPVFGFFPLLLPIAVVAVLAYGCVEVTTRRPVLAPFRPVLILVTGLLGLIESVLFATTAGGLPTAASLSGVWRGLTEGWLRTLQSTWPARPDAELLLFVPLAVLLATTIAVELLVRLRTAAVALLPGLVVAGLAQAFQAATGFGAVLAAAGWSAPAALVLWAARPSRADVTRPAGGPRRRRLSTVHSWLAVPTVLAIAAGGILVGQLDPAGREPYRLKDDVAAPVTQNRISNPLREVAQRLARPDQEVFRYRADSPVDRWSMVVLNGFDGANWSTDARLRRLGAPREGDGTTRTADVQLGGSTGPWLPSQPVPLGVDGVAPLVDQETGTLLDEGPGGGERRYRLSWSEPTVDAATLGAASVDPRAPGGLGGVGVVPPDIDRLAAEAVHGLRPTFQAALQLERFLSANYRLVTGGTLPTGSGWPQLRHFLTETKRGTSEQFAAAYVLLARLNGIPARLAVGYRGTAEADGGEFVVRNRDVLAWPEVAVSGVGWVPLDPASAAAATDGGAARTGLAKAAEQARAQLPPEHHLRPPELPKPAPKGGGDPDTGDGGTDAGLVAAGVLPAGLLCWLLGVPLAKVLRARRRRRRTGMDGVLGAWAEARDRLRGHGVPYRVGMTPRDLAAAADPLTGKQTSEAISRLGSVLDMALWSGAPVTGSSARRAWDEVRMVRKGLARRPLGTRLRAALNPRPLFSADRDRRAG